MTESDRDRVRERDEDRSGGGAAAAAATAVATPPGERMETPLTSAIEKSRRAGKLSKKERRLIKDNHRPLDSWERYRALTDVLDESIDLVDLADHKARFALVIMAALNVLLFFVATRTDIVEDLPGNTHVWLAGYLFVYVLVALYFFLQAIESLRPRKEQPQVPYRGESGPEEHPLGIRFYEDILNRNVDDYRKAWRDLRIGQLNNELAVQAHALASINHAKYKALRRLYMGLKILTLMAVGMVGLAALAAFIGTARAGAHGRKNSQVFGSANRLATGNVREPSGVAVHPGIGHLFVVGDDGSLGEFDGSGNPVRAHPISGNLEDVAAHPGTGWLLLLDEQRSQISAYDPASQRVVKRWTLDRAAFLGEQPGPPNDGFEGLAFREEAGRPGGGVFYLVHQRTPAMMLAFTLDPVAAPAGPLPPQSVIGRWPIPGKGDLTAVTWVAAVQRLVVIADKEDLLLVVGNDGSVQSEIPLPGQQQEGVAFDAAGNLWVADDQDKALLKMDGAQAAMEKFLTDPASFQGPLG